MTSWVFKGLSTGIKSVHYPDSQETTAGISPGRPRATCMADTKAAETLAAVCPTGSIVCAETAVSVDYRSCVHCFRCHRNDAAPAVEWEKGYEWAAESADSKAVHRRLDKVFGRSLHIRFVDAGACGACISEARHLNNPYYNIHRLGFFITPTPRNADVLLVAGPLTDAMRMALRNAFEAMPTPKRVIAIGACALSGGIFGPSFAAADGVAGIVPVDVMVPGCPPPPLAIMHAILVAVERKPPVALTSSAEKLNDHA